MFCGLYLRKEKMEVRRIVEVLQDALKIGLCLFGTIAAFFSVIDLTYFLSIPNDPKKIVLGEGRKYIYL